MGYIEDSINRNRSVEGAGSFVSDSIARSLRAGGSGSFAADSADLQARLLSDLYDGARPKTNSKPLEAIDYGVYDDNDDFTIGGGGGSGSGGGGLGGGEDGVLAGSWQTRDYVKENNEADLEDYWVRGAPPPEE